MQPPIPVGPDVSLPVIPQTQGQRVSYSPVLGFGTGASDDSQAILSAIGIAGTNQTVQFRPGTYLVNANLVIASAVQILPGAKIKPANGVTITFNGPVSIGLHQGFDTSLGGTILFSRGSVAGIYQEWFYSSGKWDSALLAACNSVAPFSGIPLRFCRSYQYANKITVPNSGGVSQPLVWEGDGGAGDGFKPELIWDDTATGGLDFAAFGDYVCLRRLQFNNAVTPVNANHGIGLNFGSSSYISLDDIWITNFDKNINISGFVIYSKWHRVRSHYGYTACLNLGAGALLNAVEIDQCAFGNSVNGTGVLGSLGGSAAIGFKHTYFEGNHGCGINVTGQGAINAKFENCYFEANGDIDAFIENDFSGSTSLVHFDSCYFDPNGAVAHVRIQVRDSNLVLVNNRIYSIANSLTPPVHLGQSPGTQPWIALNNEYDTSELTDFGLQGGFIVDTKHPYIAYSNAVAPTNYSSIKAGQFFYNTDETTLALVLGWLCTVSGAGAGVVPNPAVTATTVNGSANIVLSDTSSTISPGDYITIAGVTFQGAAFARVLNVPSNGHLQLEKTCDQTVAGAAVGYRASTLITVPSQIYGDSAGSKQKIASGVQAGVAATVISTSAQDSGVDTGNKTLVFGYDLGTGTKLFWEEVSWITNGAVPTVITGSTQTKNAPEARTYTVVGNTLKVAMAASTYVIKTINQMSGIDS